MKLPVVITYVSDQHGGKELKYSLRSLKYISNWNGKVYVIGDKEKWFSPKVNYIRTGKYGNSWVDQSRKVATICANPDIPDDFILTQDDVYITKRTKVTAYYQGELPTSAKTPHKRSKVATRYYLEDNAHPTLDYECHAPMVINKEKYMKVYNVLLQSDTPLQLRSIYGNMNNIGGELFEDMKTKTHELPKAKIISTQFYTDELDKMFPEPSQFEA